MDTISLCMIVRDEEPVLIRCLESAAGLYDELVIVDTGSADRTREIARGYTDKVYNFPWVDDFSAARNFAFERASMHYCMWLDADDVIPENQRDRFLSVKENDLPAADVVMLPYHTAFDAAGRPTFTYYRERIVRNDPRFRWKGAVHEAIAPAGKVIYREAAVEHRKEGPGDPDRNLRIFQGILARGDNLEPREQFYYGRELFYHRRYEEAVQVLEAFLTQGWGWSENNADACRVLAACYDALHQPRFALRALLEGLSYGRPRAELCCDIAARFYALQDYRQAIWWYERALDCPRPGETGGFVSPDCYGYLPCIQLCLCWYALGEAARAAAYNERAGEYKPEDPAYLYNKTFFEARQ